MNYSEWTRNKTSLFQAIFELIEDERFSEFEPVQLDSTFTFLHGEKKVPKKIEDLTVNEVAKILVTLYNKKWVNVYDLLFKEMVSGVSSSVISTNEKKDVTERITSSSNESNTSAFNDNEYVPESEAIESLLDDTKNDSTGTNKVDTKSLWAVQQQLRMVDDSFIQVMFKDVSKQITLSIY